MRAASRDNTAAPAEHCIAVALSRLGDSDALAAYLDDVLNGLRGSCWPTIAWRFSPLTADGYPVELSFTSMQSAARFTAEVAGAEVEHERRFELALDHLPETLRPRDAEMLDRLRRLQAGAALRWGAWFSGRITDGRRTGKVYVEAPRGRCQAANDLAAELLGASPSAVLERDVPLRMVGWDPASKRVELYLKVGTLDDVTLARVLALGGQGRRLPELLEIVADACQTAAEPVFAGANYGCSFSVLVDNPGTRDAVIVSVTAFAHGLFGRDARTRGCVLQLAERRRWDFADYAAVSEPLAAHTDWPTSHGMVSFVLAEGYAPQLHVGLRPPVG